MNLDLNKEFQEWVRITQSLPGKTRDSLDNLVYRILIKMDKEFRKNYTDLNNKLSNCLLNENKVSEIYNEKEFYKQQLYGSEKEPGYLKLLAEKENKLEYFNNINNIEGMSIIEGITTKELDEVIKENLLLENQIQKNQNNYSADDTKVFYKQQQFYRQKNFNYFLIILFRRIFVIF